MKIMLINGPNLDLLGKREPAVYGGETLYGILDNVQNRAMELGVSVESRQSNIEGELVGWLGHADEVCDAVIFNPGAYTHTSIALRDAITASGIPCVEVHISNIYSREEFRHTSLTAAVSTGVLSGFGGYGYIMALEAVVRLLKEKNSDA